MHWNVVQYLPYYIGERPELERATEKRCWSQYTLSDEPAWTRPCAWAHKNVERE